MLRLSQFLNMLVIGDPAHAASVILQRASIDVNTGTATASATGNDLVILNAPVANGSVVTPNGQLRAVKVWGAVWNDFADYQKLNDRLEFGKCYFDTIEGARICTERCQMGVIGVASNTFGQCVGLGANTGPEVPIAVAGWVLAFVDREYPCGTPLTNDALGNLTEMTLEEKMKYPERLVATYKKPEYDQWFGPEGQQIAVNGRHWVKVK